MATRAISAEIRQGIRVPPACVARSRGKTPAPRE
jgi:hypothetical protein